LCIRKFPYFHVTIIGYFNIMLYVNKFARFKYEVDDEYEAGMSLDGVQVKQIRAGKMNIKESVMRMDKSEVYIMHTGLITDKIKLLLNTKEIEKIEAALNEKKNQVFPLGIFTKGRLLKIKIGVGPAKKQYQKTEQQKRKDAKIQLGKDFKVKNF